MRKIKRKLNKCMSNRGEPDAPEQMSREAEWSAFYDDEGRIYYYNEKSGESSWDAPEHFNPPPTEDEEHTSSKDPDSPDKVIANEKLKEIDQSIWITYTDDEGREYYFNTETEETTWDRPDGLGETRKKSPVSDPETATESPKQESPYQTPTKRLDVKPDDNAALIPTNVRTDGDLDDKEIEPVANGVDNHKIAEEVLNRPDAIQEPGVMTHVTEIVSRDDGNPDRAIQALSKSYSGTTAVCGLLSRWLADLKSLSVASASVDSKKRLMSQQEAFRKSADDIREMTQAVVFKISREKFTNKGGDSILNLQKNEVTFLEKMMNSKRWRGLLIDLSASNKDSAMLRYCLKAISKRGHHREIASRIDQSDHFAVFDAMLASELAAVAKIAVSLCLERDSTIHLGELVKGLRRTCSSTAYTYAFALEVCCTKQDVALLFPNNESKSMQCYLLMIDGVDA